MTPDITENSQSGVDGSPSASGGRTTTFELSIEQVGRCLPDYEVTRVVGSGAMGVVFEANHRPLSRRVALKVLPPGLASREATIQRFLREAEIVARIHHEHIVPIYDVGSRSGLHYIAMRFVPGVSLDRTIAAAPLSPREVATIGVNIARALAYAHSQGIIHRDVKPANILREPDGRVSLTDFGLARVDGSGTMTESGALVGTPNYMSPEQIQGTRESVDGRSDVYSLGVTLYELISQKPPFQEATTTGTLKAILEKPAPRLRKIRPDCPTEIEIILGKAMRKDPAARYANATALADDLERYLNGQPILAKRESIFVRTARYVKARRGVFIAGSIAALLAIGTIALVVNNQKRAAQNYINSARAGMNDPKAVESVKKNLELAHNYSSTRRDACLLRAEFALKAGDQDAKLIDLAIEDCRELLASSALDVDQEVYVLYLQARFALQKGNVELAQSSSMRCAKIAPNHSRSLIIFSIITIEAGRGFDKQNDSEKAREQYSEAVRNLTKVVADDDANVSAESLDPVAAELLGEAHLELGTAYALLGDSQAADKEFVRAAALSPRNAEVHKRRGDVLRSEGKDEAAGMEEALAKAINPFINVSRTAPEIGSDLTNSMINFTKTVRGIFDNSASKPVITAGSRPASQPARSF